MNTKTTQETETISTPFGNIEKRLFDMMLKYVGVRESESGWIIQSFPIHLDDIDEVTWLPTGFYNFELALQKVKYENLTDTLKHKLKRKDLRTVDPTTKEVLQALNYDWGNKYLPRLLNKKSYSELYREAGLG